MKSTPQNSFAFMRRKPKLIYPAFQMKLVGYQLLSTFAVLGIVKFQNYRTFQKLNELGNQVPLPKGHAYFEFLSYQNTMFNSYLLTAFAVGVLVSLVSTLILSHRVAGPIVRLKGYLKSIASSGEVPENQLGFREHDFFEDLPGSVNAALSAIHQNEKKLHPKQDAA